MKKIDIATFAVATTMVVSGCAGSDNPTALADLDPVTEFEITASEIETMRAVEITARVRESGRPMHLRDTQIEVRPPIGPARLVALSGDEHGYSAQVRFYEPGEHDLHLLGQPAGHHLMREMGEHAVEVEAQHQIFEEHRFELSVTPAPIVPGLPARVTLQGWEIEDDGTLGHEAEGLHLVATLHLPGGGEAPIQLTEVEHGVFSANITFPAAGSYEFSVEIEDDDGDDHADPGDDHGDEGDDHGAGMEFEIHVPPLDGGSDDAPAQEGDEDGHGH